MPLHGVELLESFVAQKLKLLVGLGELGTDSFFVCGVALAHGVLLVRLVPLGVAVNGRESRARCVVSLVGRGLTRECSCRYCVHFLPSSGAGRWHVRVWPNLVSFLLNLSKFSNQINSKLPL